MENGKNAGSERCCVNSTRDKQQKGVSRSHSRYVTSNGSRTIDTALYIDLGDCIIGHCWWSRGRPWNWRSRGLQEQHGWSWREQPQEQKSIRRYWNRHGFVSKQGPLGEPGLQLRWLITELDQSSSWYGSTLREHGMQDI